jgi:hypothetical protein
LRHVNGRAQTTHILDGRFALAIVLPSSLRMLVGRARRRHRRAPRAVACAREYVSHAHRTLTAPKTLTAPQTLRLSASDETLGHSLRRKLPRYGRSTPGPVH